MDNNTQASVWVEAVAQIPVVREGAEELAGRWEGQSLRNLRWRAAGPWRRGRSFAAGWVVAGEKTGRLDLKGVQESLPRTGGSGSSG